MPSILGVLALSSMVLRGELQAAPISSPQETHAMSAKKAEASEQSGQKDFDFLIGRWKVKNRRLRERLKGSNQWDEFESTVVARHIWGGKANTDEYEGAAPFGPIQGMTLRLFDPSSRQWRLYWANSASGILDRPVVGSFENGRGEFYNEDVHEGRSIYTRFLWSDITETSCRWEQAFSTDGGKSWETNWIMEFSRER